MSKMMFAIGIPIVASRLKKMGDDAEENLDKLVLESMGDVQQEAHDLGPVKTGLMVSTILDSANVVPTPGKNLSYDLIEATDYTTIQEYTNPRHPGFLQRAIIKEGKVLPRKVRAFYKGKGSKL